MFEYVVGASTKSRAVVSSERRSAQRRWPFLTNLDLSMIRNLTQLSVMVRDRTGRSQALADTDVQNWMSGELSARSVRMSSKVLRLADYRGGVAAYYPGATMR